MKAIEAFFKAANKLLDWEISVSFLPVNPAAVDIKIL